MMKIFKLLVLIILVVKGFPDLFKVICSPLTVQAQPGQDVVLSCRVEPPFDLSHRSLEWKRGLDTVHVYRSQGDDQDSQDPKFKGRTFLIHQNLKDANISLRLTNVTKEDEGNYTCFLPMGGMKCSTITLIVPQRTNETHTHPVKTEMQRCNTEGSGLGPGVIAGIVFGVIVVVVLGILAFFNLFRRNRTDLPTDSASIALRDMGRTEPFQPPSDEGGVDPGQVTSPLMIQSHGGDAADS